jgi:hypothetical protein
VAVKTKPAEVVALETICRDHGINFYNLPPDAHAMLTVLLRLGQDYAVHVVNTIKDQLLAQIDKVAEEHREGYQIAIRAIAGGAWENRGGGQ